MRAKGFGTQMNADAAQMNAEQVHEFHASVQLRHGTRIAFPRSSALHLRSSAFTKLFVSFFLAVSPLAHAEVTVKDAWVRGTVPAQTTTGAFMTLTSTADAKLLSASSPVAKTVEIHESMMHGSTAHMHAVEAVALPAGKAVSLKPGGHHVMLMGLARPLKPGDTVPLTLTIEEKGKRSTLQVQAAVRPLGSP
jgi:copper(I)-binding protein